MVPNSLEDLFGCDESDSTICLLVGAHGGVVRGARDAANAADDARPSQDWAQGSIPSAVHGDGYVMLLVFLELKGNGDTVGKV